MSVQPPDAFPAPVFTFHAAVDAAQQNGAAALRHQVFCVEQGLFTGSDRDAIDEVATTLVARDAAGTVVGTVRIHAEANGLWWGSRLAVAASHRRVARIGGELIRLAVSTAQGRGCTRFLAHVQVQNGPLFLRMHWAQVGETVLHGLPHLRMQADLAQYPPLHDPEIPRRAIPGPER